MQRPTYRRDTALTMFLLDTGHRASEVCALRIGDLDMKTGEVTVRHGKEGGAKGDKGRTVYAGKGTRRTLWRYLVEREDGENEQAPLFATIDGVSMLVHQGAVQFELWTSMKAPVEIMRRAVLDELSDR